MFEHEQHIYIYCKLWQAMRSVRAVGTMTTVQGYATSTPCAMRTYLPYEAVIEASSKFQFARAVRIMGNVRSARYEKCKT